MRPVRLASSLLAGFLLAGCAGRQEPAPDSGTNAEERAARRAKAKERAVLAERAESKAREDASEAVRTKRDSEELARILELRGTDPAEAERRESEFLIRKCRSEEDARWCGQLARKYASQGRYEEARNAVRTGMSILEKSGSASAYQSRQLDELRRLDEELERRQANWFVRIPSPPPGGIGLGSGTLPSR